MSNTPRATGNLIPEYQSGGTRKILKADKAPFKLDGVLYTLIKPKKALMAQMASVIDPSKPFETGDNAKNLLMFSSQMIANIEDEESDAKGAPRGRQLLLHRLNDANDSLDLDDLMPIFTNLMNGWFKRPTGPLPASAARRSAPSARVSRARTR